jgi:hypothetical protein
LTGAATAGDRGPRQPATTYSSAALRYVAPWCSGAPSGSPGTRPCGQLLRFDGLAPHPNRSRNVMGSRMAGARRAALLRLLARGRSWRQTVHIWAFCASAGQAEGHRWLHPRAARPPVRSVEVVPEGLGSGRVAQL